MVKLAVLVLACVHMHSLAPKALVKVGYSCNNNCVFCHSSPHRSVDTDLAELEKKILLARSLGAAMLVLSGGEPTIRRDLLDIAGLVERSGMGLGLVTNGRMLAYADLLERLLDLGLGYVYLSLCGPDAKLHDRHTRSEAFDQILQAIGRLSKRVDDFTVNVVVTAWNLDRLEEFAPLLHRAGPARLKFSFIEPEGNALQAFEDLVPPLALAAGAVRETVHSATAGFPRIRIAMDGFPLCLMDGLEDLDAGLRQDGFFAMSEAFENGFFAVDDRNRSFGDRCAVCSLRRRCRGVFTTYLRRRGEDELRPVVRPVPNSFNLVPTAAVEDLDLRSCPIRAGRRPPPDAVRGLMVRTSSGQVVVHSTDTADFSDETVQRAIQDREQVYLDLGDGPVLSDFADQLKKLQLAAACKRCPLKVNCGGLFRPARCDSFSRVKNYLDDVLGGLRGRILDVGCGLSPYLDALEPALKSGRLQYVGIDPAVDNRRSEKGQTWIRTSLEDFRFDGPRFDAVLALRSLNHLTSPLQGLRKMADLLRPAGRMILAEDEVFGTVRSRQKARKVERLDDLPFEHRFNLDLEEARRLAERSNLRLIEQRTSAQTKSTLWIIVLQKGNGTV